MAKGKKKGKPHADSKQHFTRRCAEELQVIAAITILGGFFFHFYFYYYFFFPQLYAHLVSQTHRHRGLAVVGREMRCFSHAWGPQHLAATPAARGRTKRAFPSPGSRLPPLSPHLAHAEQTATPGNAAGLAHNGSRMGHRRRTTGPLLPRRDPKSAFPGKKAELSRAFQCVFSQKNKYKGIMFFLQGTAL